MFIPEGPLQRSDIDHFLQYGFVVLEDCFPTGPGTLAQTWLDRAWMRVGYDRDDPGTWAEAKVHLPIDELVPVADFAPKALQAMQQLCGPDRIPADLQWPDAFILNLHWQSDRDDIEPGPSAQGWHKDGDFFVHFLDSPEQALLCIVIWEDVLPKGGATYIAADSIGLVARHLAATPEGVCPLNREMRQEQGVDPRVGQMNTRALIEQCQDFREMTGKAGTVVLMHPYMLHTPSPNVLKVPRFITNPCVAFNEPMNFNRADGAHSPVEQAVLNALDVERYDFQPQTERRRVVPRRMQEWERQRRARAERESA